MTAFAEMTRDVKCSIYYRAKYKTICVMQDAIKLLGKINNTEQSIGMFGKVILIHSHTLFNIRLSLEKSDRTYQSQSESGKYED